MRLKFHYPSEGSNVSATLIDHLTVTAPTLEIGAEFVRRALGVTPQKGGEHPRMGTHNLLLRLGDALFLEVIAADPNAPTPDRPRWFSLDTLQPDSASTLTTWVARTSDIHANALACSEPLGNIEPMSRGALNWLITIPSDGSLPMNGVIPTLIEWQTETHPAANLIDFGLSLARLELYHPEPERVSCGLASIGLDKLVHVLPTTTEHTMGLVAHINTPHGCCVLR